MQPTDNTDSNVHLTVDEMEFINSIFRKLFKKQMTGTPWHVALDDTAIVRINTIYAKLGKAIYQELSESLLDREPSSKGEP